MHWRCEFGFAEKLAHLLWLYWEVGCSHGVSASAVDLLVPASSGPELCCNFGAVRCLCTNL